MGCVLTGSDDSSLVGCVLTGSDDSSVVGYVLTGSDGELHVAVSNSQTELPLSKSLPSWQETVSVGQQAGRNIS